METAAIFRKLPDDGIQTIGKFKCEKEDGELLMFDTLELPDKNNHHNISCIPLTVGNPYLVVWSFSTRHQKFSYEITGVPNRSGIRFDVANWSRQLLGCVGAGSGYMAANEAGEIEIINSQKTNDKLNAFFNKQSFLLEIVPAVIL